MNSLKILITGGAGYVGTELVYELAAAEDVDEIVVYDNLCKRNFNLFTGLRKLPLANIRFMQGDILDRRSLESAIEGVDVLFHLAARVEVPFADQNAHEFEQVNNWGTAEVMFAAEAANVGTVIYLSSQSVYGAGDVEDSNFPTSPNCFYGVTKLRGERHVVRLAANARAIVIRCAQIYGYSKNLRFETTINRMIFDAHFSNKITVHGDPEYTCPHISIDRLARELAKMVRFPVPSGIYNLSHRDLSSLDIAESLRVVYPELETIFVDQHIWQESLYMRSSETFRDLYNAQVGFTDDLKRFGDAFTF